MSARNKILGVYVDDNLLCNDQFHHVSNKLSSYVWLLSKIRSYFSFDHRKLFYKAYIKAHIEYCSVVWCNTSSSNINKILNAINYKDGLSMEYNELEESL